MQKMKQIFDDLVYAVFGIIEPKPQDERFDIATGGYDVDEGIPMLPSKIPTPTGKKLPPDVKKKRTGKGLKIMTPSQLITRLPILVAQKQAGNNSQKLNNEIRQIIYSLHRSKNLSKTIYNHLINSI